MAKRKPERKFSLCEPQKASGSTADFPYREMPERILQPALLEHAERLRPRYLRLAKKWDAARNSEWLVRSYFALKLMVASNLVLSLGKEGLNGWWRLARPDVMELGLFHAARAFALVLPDQPWERGGFFARTDITRAAKVARRRVGELDPMNGRWIGRMVNEAHEYRKLFWAHYPLSGRRERRAGDGVGTDEAVQGARLLCELAQWHTEILAGVLAVHAEDRPGYDVGVVAAVSHVLGDEGVEGLDSEDARRIGELMAAAPRPESLYELLRVRLAEDFERSWAGAPTDDVLINWRLIFPFR